MSDFNLLSANKTEEIASKSKINFSRNSLTLLGTLSFFIALSVITFIVNLYYDNQLNDKGKMLIDLQNNQNNYIGIINSLESINSRGAASSTILSQRILTEDIISQIDTITNSTVTNYVVDTSTKEILINGKAKDINEAVNISEKLKTMTQFTNVRLMLVSKLDKDLYNYNISFLLNSEKVQP